MSRIDHYENFPVASWLCPRRIRPAVLAIYRFARTADDLADEGEATMQERLFQMAQFRNELSRALRGEALAVSQWQHMLESLQQHVAHHALNPQHLFDLLDAFEQDVVYTGLPQVYRDRQSLLHYCQRSANPVGRLMLQLYGVNDPLSLQQSDAICSALQLINFWQDRQTDLQRGRDYLPAQSDMASELAFARALLQQGQPLVFTVGGRAGWELRAVLQGGLRILDKLDRLQQQFGGDGRDWPRPVLTRLDGLRIVWRSLRMSVRG